MSENAIIGAIIGGSATIAAALITWLANARLKVSSSSKYRQQLGLVDPQGRWECEWYNEDGTLYVKDMIEIEGWIKNGRFEGKGTQPTLSYTVHGEIDSTRALAMTYRTEDFPKTAYVGAAFLIFDIDGEILSGRWYGRTKSGNLGGGETKWHRTSAVQKK